MINNEDGFSSVMLCIFILVVMAIGAILVDAGMAMIFKTELDHATEIAVGQAAQESYDVEEYERTGQFVLDQSITSSLVVSYLNLNIRNASVTNMVFKPEEPNAVYVTTSFVYDTQFMKIFGIEEMLIRSNVKGYVFEKPSEDEDVETEVTEIEETETKEEVSGNEEEASEEAVLP